MDLHMTQTKSRRVKAKNEMSHSKDLQTAIKNEISLLSGLPEIGPGTIQIKVEEEDGDEPKSEALLISQSSAAIMTNKEDVEYFPADADLDKEASDSKVVPSVIKTEIDLFSFDESNPEKIKIGDLEYCKNALKNTVCALTDEKVRLSDAIVWGSGAADFFSREQNLVSQAKASADCLDPLREKLYNSVLLLYLSQHKAQVNKECESDKRHEGYSAGTKQSRFLCYKCGNNISGNCAILTHLCSCTWNVNINKTQKRTVKKKKIACEQCGKHYNKDYFKSHLLLHTGERPFSCSECGKAFALKAALNSHQRVHTGEMPYTCTECGKGFYNKNKLNIHHHRIHTGENPFACMECGKGFYSKDKLNIHHRIHTGENPFACIECGRVFSCKSKLRAHFRIHTRKKPFTCTECGKAFFLKNKLRNHQIIHTGVKPYTCSECGKSFFQHGSLHRHEAIHRREKAFTCLQCGAKFSGEAPFNRHCIVHLQKKMSPCEKQ